MRLTLAFTALLVALPLAAEEKKTVKVTKSGCQVGEGMPKFTVAPVTGKFASKKGICYI